MKKTLTVSDLTIDLKKLIEGNRIKEVAFESYREFREYSRNLKA